MNLHTVQDPIYKKPLLLYMTTNSYAIGALIAQEDGGSVEQLVYFLHEISKWALRKKMGSKELGKRNSD